LSFCSRSGALPFQELQRVIESHLTFLRILTEKRGVKKKAKQEKARMKKYCKATESTVCDTMDIYHKPRRIFFLFLLLYNVIH